MNAEQGAQTQHHVEHLLDFILEGTEALGPWLRDHATLLEMEELGLHEALNMVVPYQYLLCTIASDEARRAVRQAAEEIRATVDQLLALLDVYDQAAQGEHPEWAKFIALKKAPFPVEIPPNCDTRDPDVIAVMIRDILHDGSWGKAIEWIRTEGSAAQRQHSIPRARELAAFEEAYDVNLADLLFSDEAKAEHEQLRAEYRAGRRGKLKQR